MHVRKAPRPRGLAERLPATYMVFDLIRLDGRDLTGMPLGERRGILRGLGWSTRRGRCPTRTTTARCCFDATLQQGLEGIVSKRLTSRYAPGSAPSTG